MLRIAIIQFSTSTYVYVFMLKADVIAACRIFDLIY